MNHPLRPLVTAPLPATRIAPAKSALLRGLLPALLLAPLCALVGLVAPPFLYLSFAVLVLGLVVVALAWIQRAVPADWPAWAHGLAASVVYAGAFFGVLLALILAEYGGDVLLQGLPPVEALESAQRALAAPLANPPLVVLAACVAPAPACNAFARWRGWALPQRVALCVVGWVVLAGPILVVRSILDSSAHPLFVLYAGLAWIGIITAFVLVISDLALEVCERSLWPQAA